MPLACRLATTLTVGLLLFYRRPQQRWHPVVCSLLRPPATFQLNPQIKRLEFESLLCFKMKRMRQTTKEVGRGRDAWNVSPSCVGPLSRVRVPDDCLQHATSLLLCLHRHLSLSLWLRSHNNIVQSAASSGHTRYTHHCQSQILQDLKFC
jgi:hypothetical protein